MSTGWLYTRGRPSLGHNSGQSVELVVVPWRVGRQMPNGFLFFLGNILLAQKRFLENSQKIDKNLDVSFFSVLFCFISFSGASWRVKKNTQKHIHKNRKTIYKTIDKKPQTDFY
jgi:hypothetical protein